MNDPEQPKDIADGQHDFQSSDTSKKSEPSYTTNFKDKIVGKITSTTLGKADRNVYLFWSPLGYQIILGQY